jgi:tape measure domain-containing protein
MDSELRLIISATETATGVVAKLAGALTDLAGTIAGTLVSAFAALGRAAAEAAGILGGTLLAALLAVGKAGVDMHVSIERATLAMTKIGGSAQGASALLAGIKQEALTSALTFKQLIPIGQQLLAVYGPAGIGQVIPTIRAFGDAAATLGVDSAGLERALLGFRQLVSAPKINARDIRQIGENLPGSNPNQFLAAAFGTGDTEVLAKAGVTGAQAADAIVKGFVKRFGGAQVELSHTLPIILSNFEDAFNNLAQAVTTRFAPALTRGLDAALQTISGFATNGKLIEALAVPFDLLGKAIEAAAGQLPAFVDWLSQVLTKENIVNLLAQVVGYVQAIGQEVARFLGVVGGGATFTQVWQAFQKAAETAIDVALKAWNAFVAAVQFFIQNAPELWQIAADSMKPLLKAFDTLLGLITVIAGGKLLGGIGGGVGNLLGPLLGMGGGAAALAGGAAIAGPTAILGALGGPYAAAMGWAGKQGPLGKAAQGAMGFLWPGAALLGMGTGMIDPGNSVNKAVAGGAGAGLEGIGKGVREMLFGGLEAAFKAGGDAIPERIKNLFGRFKDQVGQAYAEGGLAPFQRNQRQAADAARRALGGLLAGSPTGTAGGPAMPGSELLFGGGGDAAAQAAKTLSGKELRAAAARDKSFYDAQLNAARAQVELLPEQQQAVAAAAALTPILRAKQQALIEEAAKVAAGSKEYYDLAGAYWQTEKQINDLAGKASKERQDLIDDAGKAAKKAQADQLKTADLAVKLAEQEAKNRGQKPTAAIPALLAKFGLLAGGRRPGESEEEFMARKLEASQTRGEILDVEGLGEKARRSVNLRGGGSVDLSDRRRAGGINAYLDRVQRGPGGGGGAGAAPALKVEVTGEQPLAAMLAAVLSDPAAARALAAFLADLMGRGQNRAGYGAVAR